MRYENKYEEDIQFTKERHALTIERLHLIMKEETVDMPYRLFFQREAEFLVMLEDTRKLIADGSFYEAPIEMLQDMNHLLYRELQEPFYEQCYGNPVYAVSCFGEAYGRLLSFLYTELRSEIPAVYEGRLYEITIWNELFIEIYNLFEDGETLTEHSVRDAIYAFYHDYADYFVTERLREQLDAELDFATRIVMEEDLTNAAYLYRYGEFIGENELGLAMHFANMEDADVEAMARTYTEGFREGFAAAGIDLSKKKYVNIRYSIGQERMVRAAIHQFHDMGLTPVLYRTAWNRIHKKGVLRIGYLSTSPNKQFEFDHRQDEALFLDKAFIERKLALTRGAYETYKELAGYYAGPACIEVFGETPFVPESRKESILLTEKQQKLSVEYNRDAGLIVNEYIPRNAYSFTIIAYPVPEIGPQFSEIFDETVKVNTLDSEAYRRYQQVIIDVLDKAEYVHVKGTGPNRTDMKVMLHPLEEPEKQTNFENCVADVNIPVGEVFTSPMLTGTEGTLHVSGVYLNELYYDNLELTFRDGRIATYTCDNFEDEAENQKYIRENVLFNHDTLPIGEFAIGTNTTAYRMAKRYGILAKLPILIVEKMGPHFAVGDTCYSYSEENRLFNPDGKEIIAKDNECSLQRLTDRSKAYFNCHTDITIPYEEIGRITAVTKAGEEYDIIRDGLFTLEGLEALNAPLLNA